MNTASADEFIDCFIDFCNGVTTAEFSDLGNDSHTRKFCRRLLSNQCIVTSNVLATTFASPASMIAIGSTEKF
jgi:hypothetical protein